MSLLPDVIAYFACHCTYLLALHFLLQWDSDLEISDSDDDDFVAAKPAPNPRAAPKKAPVKVVKAAHVPTPAPVANTSTIDEAVSVLENLSINDAPVAKAPAKKAPAPAKKVVSKAPAKKTPAAKKAPVKKKKAYDSSDEDSDDFMGDSDSDSDVEVVAPVPARGRSARAASKVTYVLDDSSDEEFDEDSDEEF